MAQTNNQTVYYRQNGAPVQNKVHIDAVRKQQLKDAVCNNRLGRYNAHGRYTLSPKITKELLGITKYVYQEHFDAVVKESKDTLEFKATSNLPVFGNLEFRIVFKDTFAKLYLIENVYREFNGYQEIYGEQITEINCETDRTDMIDYVFALLNVSVVDEVDYGKTEDEEKVVAILTSKIYFSMAARNYLKDSAPDEKETFEDMVNLLKEEGGEYGKRVLRNFIDRIEKRPDIMQLKDEDGYNEALNDALIGALEVATTEDDMLDPAKKDLYDRLYKKRFHKTDGQIKEGQEKINDKDFNKVAEALLGRDKARIFDNENIASKLEEYARLVEGLKIPTEQPIKEDVKEELDLLTELVRARAAGENVGAFIKQRGISKSDPEFLRQMREKAEREAAENAEETAAVLKDGGKGKVSVKKPSSTPTADIYKDNPSKIWGYKIKSEKPSSSKPSGGKGGKGPTISTKPYKTNPEDQQKRTTTKWEEALSGDYVEGSERTSKINTYNEDKGASTTEGKVNTGMKKERPFETKTPEKPVTIKTDTATIDKEEQIYRDMQKMYTDAEDEYQRNLEEQLANQAAKDADAAKKEEARLAAAERRQAEREAAAARREEEMAQKAAEDALNADIEAAKAAATASINGATPGEYGRAPTERASMKESAGPEEKAKDSATPTREPEPELFL